jgi:hypothetical protein
VSAFVYKPVLLVAVLSEVQQHSLGQSPCQVTAAGDTQMCSVRRLK